MCLIGSSKCFQFYDSCLISYSPWNDLFGMFTVIGLDDCPATMSAVVAAPFEMMQITRGVDFLNNCITFAGVMWGFDKIAIHGTSPHFLR
jgi:hypothetical protein